MTEMIKPSILICRSNAIPHLSSHNTDICCQGCFWQIMVTQLACSQWGSFDGMLCPEYQAGLVPSMRDGPESKRYLNR